MDDLISRQAVRHILNHEVKMPIEVWKKLFKLVDCLPPVTPQPTTGRWTSYKNEDNVYKCTACGAIVYEYPTSWDYCPWCGEKKEVKQNG